ncbi:hypothetical protein TNCV_2850651 [Trichonephila clavipes]|nr:hypothetical protein TNCV_2850651 [Trichonephila clavipes]
MRSQVAVRNNISKRWNTTENDVSKNESSADSAIRLPNTSILNSNVVGGLKRRFSPASKFEKATSESLSFNFNSDIAVPVLLRTKSSPNILILIPEEGFFNIATKYSLAQRTESSGTPWLSLDVSENVLLSFTLMNLLCKKSEILDKVSSWMLKE